MRALEEPRISIVLFFLCFSIFITFSLQANELKPSEKEGEMRMVPLMEEKFMVFACLHLVAMQLTATSLIDPLVIALSHPKLAIALVAISEIFHCAVKE
ncbi:unnamed protein product [Microthlaspi erraticum]|uniref:Uncharacterized protein n=1 Tax=Microthlaspi erraticum TaxID=1685480 RepID=A0A6D2HW24_9BRAS|nr:unnamed protein product [Microthlaspi erraticum]CAA7053239.1 unnamed protein product [Microthlaspi erraticum]